MKQSSASPTLTVLLSMLIVFNRRLYSRANVYYFLLTSVNYYYWSPVACVLRFIFFLSLSLSLLTNFFANHFTQSQQDFI